jgi:hypothetical protein
MLVFGGAQYFGNRQLRNLSATTLSVVGKVFPVILRRLNPIPAMFSDSAKLAAAHCKL